LNSKAEPPSRRSYAKHNRLFEAYPLIPCDIPGKGLCIWCRKPKNLHRETLERHFRNRHGIEELSDEQIARRKALAIFLRAGLNYTQAETLLQSEELPLVFSEIGHATSCSTLRRDARAMSGELVMTGACRVGWRPYSVLVDSAFMPSCSLTAAVVADGRSVFMAELCPGVATGQEISEMINSTLEKLGLRREDMQMLGIDGHRANIRACRGVHCIDLHTAHGPPHGGAGSRRVPRTARVGDHAGASAEGLVITAEGDGHARFRDAKGAHIHAVGEDARVHRSDAHGVEASENCVEEREIVVA
jgi:hypothetical protein